jgi:hypothetical protein
MIGLFRIMILGGEITTPTPTPLGYLIVPGGRGRDGRVCLPPPQTPSINQPGGIPIQQLPFTQEIICEFAISCWGGRQADIFWGSRGREQANIRLCSRPLSRARKLCEKAHFVENGPGISGANFRTLFSLGEVVGLRPP